MPRDAEILTKIGADLEGLRKQIAAYRFGVVDELPIQEDVLLCEALADLVFAQSRLVKARWIAADSGR